MTASDNSLYVAMLSDRPDECWDLEHILGSFAEVVGLNVLGQNEPPPAPAAIVVNIDLQGAKSISGTRRLLQGKWARSVQRIFVIPAADHRSETQAAALGATDFISSDYDEDAILAILRNGFSERFARSLDGVQASLRDGVLAANAIIVKMFEKLPTGGSFSMEDLTEGEALILNALKVGRLKGWLDTVARHHVHTYRHCLFVTGFSVAFAQHLGMREADQRRLARAALVHDVGKAFIPLAILDKPTKLSESENRIMREHSRIGFDVLLRQGGFPHETLDVVLHHHEYLDGTGYPDGQRGDDIPDITRMVTIADIFSALVEERAYKPAVPVPRALQIMEDMDGKLDPVLLKAFRQVALESAMT